MSWFKAKVNTNVNTNKGDTFKNSNISIGSGDTNSMMVEIYRSVGRLEGQCKCMLKDIAYIKHKMEDIDDRVTKVELTPGDLIKRGRLK